MARKKALKEASDAELFRELTRRHGEKTVGWGRLETPEGQRSALGRASLRVACVPIDLEAKSGHFGWILVAGATRTQPTASPPRRPW